jgi:AAHS family 4-hydroxybenzoate transporter-like MFS transporter
VLGAILARVSSFLVIGIVLGLAALMSVVVYLLPDPEFGSLIIVLGITGFILPTAYGPTRSVLAAMAYPAHIRGAGIGGAEIGGAEFGGRLGAAAGGVAGGTLIAAGMDSRACSWSCCCPSASFLVPWLGFAGRRGRRGCPNNRRSARWVSALQKVHPPLRPPQSELRNIHAACAEAGEV